MSLDHNPGCLRQYIIGFNEEEETIFVKPSFRNRWDCPGCLPDKLWKGLKHIPTQDLRTCWDYTYRIRRTASKIGAGYCAVSFQALDKRLIISTGRLFPEKPELPFARIVLDCGKVGLEIPIARLSFNRPWSPDPPESKYQTLPTYCLDLPDVMKTIADAGFPHLDLDGTPIATAARLIKNRLNTVGLDP